MYLVTNLFAFAAKPYYSDPISDELSSILDPWIENAPPGEAKGRREAADRIRRFVGTLNAYSLDLSGLRLSELPNELFKVPALIERLTTLNLNNNQLTALPAEFGSLTALTTLYLSNNQLTALPAEFGSLTALTTLYLSNNQLTALPAEFGSLTALTRLDLYNSQLTALPAEFGSLIALTMLYLSNNQLTALPAEFGSLTALTRLYLRSNQLTALPVEMMQLQSSCQVDVTGCPLSATTRVRIYKEISAAGYQGPKISYAQPTQTEVVTEDLKGKWLVILAGTESDSLKIDGIFNKTVGL